jgi:hypothetical protein
MIERNVAELLEAWRELCVRCGSKEESAEEEETDGARSFRDQSDGLSIGRNFF